MGRLLGVGFLFGARDQGATRTAANVAGGLDRVADGAREAGRSSSSLQRLGNAIGALNLMQLDRIGDSLENISERAGINPSDTGLESFGVEFSNTFRRATVGLGPFREEVEAMRGQISGLAYSLDVDANEMVSAVTAIARSGNSLDDFGLDLRSVAGSIQANILSGEQLGVMLSDLSESYELGASGATRVVDRVTAIGEAFGVGADAARQLPAVIAAADPILARFSGMSIESVTESITRLSVALTRNGSTFEQASGDAIALFSTLSEARGQITDLVTGVSSDFPELATELGIATGDIDESMQSILSDPVTFAARMRDLMGTMDRTSPAFARLQHSLSEMPANFRFLITGGEETAEALAAAQAPVENFEGSFNRMARSGAGTARTFGESMSRLEDGFKTRLNSMSSITTREVLGRQRDAYRRLGDTIDNFANGSHGGSLAFLTNAFLNVRRYGIVHGLLPMLTDGLGRAFPGLAARIEEVSPLLSELGSGFAEAATSAGPMLLAMSQLGVFRGISGGLNMVTGSLTAMLGPWGIAIAAVAAGIGLLVYNWDTVGPILTNIGPYIDEAVAELLGMSERFAEWVHSIDWVAMGEQIGDFFREAMGIAGEILGGSEVQSSIATSLVEVLRNTVGLIPEVFRGLIDGMFGDSIWSDIFNVLFDASGIGAITRAINAGSLGEALFELIFHGATLGLGPLIAGIFGDNMDLGEVGKEFTALFDEVGAALGELWDEVAGPIFEAFGMAFTSDDGIAGAGRSAFETVGEWARKMWTTYVRPAFTQLREFTVDIIHEFRTNYLGTFRTVARFIVGQIFNVIEMFGTLRVGFEQARNVFQAGFRLIGASVRRFFLSPVLQVRDSFMTITEGMQLAVDRLKLGFLSLGQTLLETIVNAIPAAIRRMIPGLDSSLTEAQGAMRSVVDAEQARIQASERRFEAASDARRAQMAALNAEETQRENEAVDAVRNAATEYERASRGIRAQRARAMSGIDRVGSGLGGRGGDDEERSASVRGGEEESTAPVVARTVDDREPASGPRTARERAAERRSAAAQADTAQDTSRARQIAREMVISSFGREAVTQLTNAMNPRGGSSSRRGRGSPMGGTGEEAL